MRNRFPKGHLYKRGSIWWVQWKHKGTPYAESLGTDNKDKAKPLLINKMNQVKAAISDGSFLEKYSKEYVPNKNLNPANDILLSNAWTDYLKSVNRPLKAGSDTLEQYAYQANRFVKWMEEKHPDIKTVSAVNKIVVREFAFHIADEESANTYNKYITLLRRVFKTLNDNLDISINPWDNIQKKEMDTQSKRDFTKEEVELILSKAQGDTYTLCLIGSQTGMRLKCCCLLEWSEVNLEERIIRHAPFKTKKKTGKVVRIYIFDKLYEYLKELKKTAKGKYVCPHMAESYLRDRGGIISRRLQAFFSKCGIELYHQGDNKKKSVAIGFHSFRHYLCTLAEEKGVPEAVAKEMFGWGSTSMKKIYTHLSDDYIIESMKKMEDKPKSKSVPLNVVNTSINNLSAEDLLKVAKSIQEELKRRQKAS